MQHFTRAWRSMGGLRSMRLPLLWTVRVQLHWREATLVLPILAAPEGQVHILQFVIELHGSSIEIVYKDVRAAARPSTCSG